MNAASLSTSSSESTARHIGRSLLFALGGEYYRVELARLKGVVAWAQLAPSEHRGVDGWLNLRGEMIPIIDLSQLLYGTPTERRLGARILLLECSSRGQRKTVGAIASEVFAMARDENSSFAEHFDPCEVLSSILLGLT